MSYNFLDKSGLTYFWGKIKDKFDSFSRNDLAVLETKEYSGLYGSANDQENASFYFASVRPTSWNTPWKVKYRLYGTIPNQTNYNIYSEVEIYGTTTEIGYKIFNRILSTSYRPMYYHNVYRLNGTGYNNGYGHVLGVGLRASTNPTSSSYPRTFKIELLETKGCTVTMRDTMVKRASLPGQGSTNYTAINELDACNNGFREQGDDNDISNLRIENGSIIAGTNGVKQNALCAMDNTDKYQSFTTTDGTGTSKTVNTSAKFRNPMIIFKNNSSTNYANGAEVGTGYQSYYANATVDLRYCCNGYADFTKNTPTYLECTKDSDGYFSVTSNIILQTGFTSGRYYIYLGNTRRDQAYYMTLQPTHPVFYYDGSKLINENELKADKSSIPTKVSQLTNDSGYTTNAGTVTSVAVKMNNTTKGTVTTSGTIDLGTVITAHQDISGKQDKLTAGSNIQIANNTISATDTKYTAGTGISISSSNVISATSSGGVTFDDVYPVGSIYMSVNNTNPSTLFGGTWEQLKDRFLLGAGDTYTAGDTGGEATHQLTKAELPAYDLYNASHSHNISTLAGYNGKQGNAPSVNAGNNQGSNTYTVSATIKVSSGGSNTPHNNMPPYLVVYMWQRVQ